ncbi:MAG: 3'-5' exoribonuclease [Bacteroidota bacterium]
MPRLFLDTEFSALTQDAALLSLALVDEQGRWFYAVFTDSNWDGLSDWHQENVVPFLLLSPTQIEQLPAAGTYLKGDRAAVKLSLSNWLSSYEQIEIWADVPAYDWVLFCELFGGALSLPENIHYIVRDLATLLEMKGYNPDIDRFTFAHESTEKNENQDQWSTSAGPARKQSVSGLVRHNALGDALTSKAVFEKIWQVNG